MDPELQSLRKQRVVAALVPLFLASGATSLVYETLWERQLHLVFGTSQVAVYTVLAAFMCGLALGGFIAARLVWRVARPHIPTIASFSQAFPGATPSRKRSP